MCEPDEVVTMAKRRKRKTAPPYQRQCTTAQGFVQQIKCYLCKPFARKAGYRYAVLGRLSGDKDADAFANKMVAKYNLRATKHNRYYCGKKDEANIVLLMYRQYYIFLATEGYHPTFFNGIRNTRGELLPYEARGEKEALQNLRESPIRFKGYAISLKFDQQAQKWRVHVDLHPKTRRHLEKFFLSIAFKRTAKQLEALFRRVPYEPYAPVRRRLIGILEKVNTRRKRHGYRKVRITCIRIYRRIYSPFETMPHRPRVAYWRVAQGITA